MLELIVYLAVTLILTFAGVDHPRLFRTLVPIAILVALLSVGLWVVIVLRDFMRRNFGEISSIRRILRANELFDLDEEVRAAMVFSPPREGIDSAPGSPVKSLLPGALLTLEISATKGLSTLPRSFRKVLFLVQGEFASMMPDYMLTRIVVLRNTRLEGAFRERSLLLRDPDRQKLRKPWPEDDRAGQRAKTDGVLDAWLKRLDAPSQDPPLDLLWHGAVGGEDTLLNIARLGFLNLATLNNG